MRADVHMIVSHGRYGKGEVIKITGGNIYVVFEKGQRIFPYPEAFEEGYLSLVSDETGNGEMTCDDFSELAPEDRKHHIMGSRREIILDAADNICFNKIFEAINAVAGTDYTGWMKAGWPSGRQEYPFWIWFPKLAETRNGKLVAVSNDCLNTISDDWNEVVYEDLKDTPPETDGNWNSSPFLIFAKEPKGGPYIFRGVYVRDVQRSTYRHHVSIRIGTRVKLIGQPSENIEILDDFRNIGAHHG